MSLRDYFQKRITTHELINLIVQLPRGCALDRAQRGEAAEWQIGDHLAAVQINDARQIAAGKRLPADKLIQPPGTKAARAEKTLGAKELDALFTGGG